MTLTKTVGLALGGGGARGWAHIGVIRALEETGIKIDYLAGTSIGALVGAVYVSDALDKLEALAEDLTLQNLLSLMDVSFPNTGLIDGQRIHDFVARYVLDKQLEQTSIPFRCVATNFLQKQEVILETGLIVDAVRASISIPGIFAPFQLEENVYLVDGGVVNPVPVSVVQAMGAEVVIAVNLNKDPKAKTAHVSDGVRRSASNANSAHASSQAQNAENRSNESSSDDSSSEQPESMAQDSSSESGSERTSEQHDGVLASLSNRYESLKDVLQDQIDQWIPDPQTGLNIFDVLGNSINMMEQRVTENKLRIDKPDVLIEPHLMEFGIFDFHQSMPMIRRGYDTAKAMLPDIKEKLEAD